MEQSKFKKFFSKLWSYIRGYIHNTDGWLIFFCLVLSGASLLFLHSHAVASGDGNSRVITQLGATLLGLLCAIIISIIDYKTLANLWKFYVPLAVLFVGLTFFLGFERGGGNRAWILIPLGSRSISIQPAEFLKIAFILSFSLHIDHVKTNLNKITNILLLCLHGGAYIALVAAQGDDGSALIFVGIFLIMLFMAGINWKYILAAIGAAVPAIFVLWNYWISDYQKIRFLVLKNPELSPDDAFQQKWGKVALGTGGVQGIGLFGNRPVSVPENHNDFIITYIGNTTGLIGVIAVLGLLLAITFKIFYNSTQAKDTTGRMICIGVFSMLMMQSIINLGMCFNVSPVIGVTLPFVSSGGTSVLATYLGIGLVLSVYCHSKSSFFGSNK